MDHFKTLQLSLSIIQMTAISLPMLAGRGGLLLYLVRVSKMWSSVVDIYNNR